MDPDFSNVIELLHASWWQPKVYERLAQQGVTFCGMSHPDLPDQLIANIDSIYYRFHGVPDLYRSAYSDDTLRRFADEVKGNSKINEAWCYFDNDAAVAAIPNAQSLTRFANE